MNKTILYINHQYVSSVKQLREMLSDAQLIKDDACRQEFLSFYRDGVLAKWYEERGENFTTEISSQHDDAAFAALYKAITGDAESPNIHSDFSKLGELLRCEVNNNAFPLRNGEIEIASASGRVSLRFVFKSLKADNNVRVFSLMKDASLIAQTEWNWKDKTRGKEFYFEFTIAPLQYQGKVLTLVEGKDNKLCRLRFQPPSSMEVKIDDMALTFYYAAPMKCWFGRLPGTMDYRALTAFINKHKAYQFTIVCRKDVDAIRQHSTELWERVTSEDFWLNTWTRYNSFHKVEDPFIKRNAKLTSWIKTKHLLID